MSLFLSCLAHTDTACSPTSPKKHESVPEKAALQELLLVCR